MSDQDNRNIEVNKSGIKLSYLRFLSDGGPGFVTIIYILIYKIIPTILPDKEYTHFTEIEFASIFIFLIFLLLLSIPLGLAINASSWVLLGWLTTGIEYFWIGLVEIYYCNEQKENNNLDISKDGCGKGCGIYITSITKNKHIQKLINLFSKTLIKKWFLTFYIFYKKIWFWTLYIFYKGTMEKYSFGQIKQFYKITKRNWYCKSCLIRETISIYYPRELEPLDHVDGVLNVIRSFFLLFLIYIGLKYNYFKDFIILISILLILLLLIMSVVSFYYDLSVFCIGYLLCQRANKEESIEFKDGDIDEIIKYLAQTSEKYRFSKNSWCYGYDRI